MLIGYSIKVYGNVQGVGFRFYTQKTALELGIRGFVKNMRDGSVYIEAEAEPELMELFINWLKQGPEWARVDRTSIQEIPLPDFKGFVIK